MSDIVERLRLLVPSDSSGAAFDAVTEIVRLRNELRIAKEWSARVIAGQEEDVRQITALRAEVERLKVEAAAQYADGAHDGSDRAQDLWAGEITALRAENERLRAVVEGIADLPPGYADMRQDDLVVILANKARAVLEEKP